MEYFNYTYHGMERTKERLGLKFRDACRRHELAAERGKGSECFKGMEREYLKTRSSDDHRAVAFDGNCYILGVDNAVITIFPLPSWWMKKKNYNGKERIRNIKKYCKMNYSMFSVY